MPHDVGKQYKEILSNTLILKMKNDLYAGQNFSRQFIEKEISPEDVISIHKSALKEVFPRCARRVLAFF